MQNSARTSIFSKWKPDLFGSAASSICMLHCMVTPFIFFVQSSQVSCREAGPWWWHALDFIFLIVGFLAIQMTHTKESFKWMPIAMYSSWFLLVLIIINAKASFLLIPELALYVPGICLIGLHGYNMKYCHCGDDELCEQ